MLAITVLTAIACGCASSRGDQEPSGRLTNLDLKSKNYQVLKANAVGKDTGWSVLCIFPLWSPQQAVAKAGLYDGLSVEGKATALANLTQDREVLFLLLACRQTLTLSADIIEFVQ